jgi:hypothetical protein
MSSRDFCFFSILMSLMFLDLSRAQEAKTNIDPAGQKNIEMEPVDSRASSPTPALRKVIWDKGWGISFEYRDCWSEDTELTHEIALVFSDIVSYKSTVSCPKEWQGKWTIRLITKVEGRAEPGPDSDPTTWKTFDPSFDPRDAKVKTTMIGKIPFFVNQRWDKSKNLNRWFAVIHRPKYDTVAFVYEEPLKAKDPPRAFLDFLGGIRLKTKADYDARAKRGKITGLEKIKV